MIQQVAFDVPKEIALGLASGEYVQYGGVVRDYTERLSKANSAKSSNVVFKLFEKKPNDISGLKECLATQREILTQAA